MSEPRKIQSLRGAGGGCLSLCSDCFPRTSRGAGGGRGDTGLETLLDVNLHVLLGPFQATEGSFSVRTCAVLQQME